MPLGALVANACVGRALERAVPSSAHPHLQRKAPSFTQRALSGQRLSSSAFAGRTWVVAFFANYCRPCHERFAALREASRQAPVIGVSLDEDIQVAATQAKTFGLPFAVILDPAHVVAGKFRVTTLPMAFVIDANNVVAWVADASVTREQFSLGLRRSLTDAGVRRK